MFSNFAAPVDDKKLRQHKSGATNADLNVNFIKAQKKQYQYQYEGENATKTSTAQLVNHFNDWINNWSAGTRFSHPSTF